MNSFERDAMYPYSVQPCIIEGDVMWFPVYMPMGERSAVGYKKYGPAARDAWSLRVARGIARTNFEGRLV